MKGKVKCSGCGHSWNKSDSSEKDMYICHKCGKDNVMKDGGWLNKYDDGSPGQENYNDSSVEVSENFVGLGYNTKGRNYSPAWGGQFQDGGKLSPLPLSQQLTSLIPKDEVEPTVPYTTTKDPAKFLKSWIQTPEFERRQLLTGYTGSPKKKYETDPIASEVRNIRLGSLGNIDPITYSSRQPSKATPGYYGSSSYVNINPSDYTGTSREAILAHELAHIGGATNLIGGMSSMEQDIFRDAMLPLKKPVISGVQDSEERNASIRNLEDFMHSQKPYEAKADLDALRFMMYDKGIYDITKGKKFTEKDFEKAKENLGKDRVFKRLTDRVGKKNFVNLMNTIASADEEIIPIAQNGASMPGSVGFTYARTINPAPSNGPYAKKTKASAQGGKDIDRVSTSDPRYAELYKNRQVGSFYDGAYNLPDLPEFVVEGKDERVKEAMARTSQGFLQGVLNTLSAPQEVTMDLLTGKQQTPSDAWGFQTPGGWLDSPTSFGKNLSNFAMDAVLDPMNLVGVGAADDVLKLGLKNIPQKAGKALGTESGLLSNAWKLNPKAYQYNLPENTMFRGIGKEGMEDATQSGVFRPRVLPKPSVPDESGIRLSPKIFDKTYYSPDFKIADKYGKDYIAEVPKTSADFTRRYSNKDWSYHTNRQIPIEEGRILQKDWLQGYKEVPKQLASSVDDVGKGFKSEIDWSKWNPDTPKYPELINEYNAIEESTKKAGTWMKNPDGSVFKGTPEQFVQQNSKNFKKAFGESKLIGPEGSPMFLYHGSAKKFDTFDPSKFQLGDAGYSGAGIYTTPSRTIANSYSTSSAKFHSGDIEPTVYQLYGQGNRPIKSSDLMKENQGRDLFNFYRARNWKGELSPYESLREYDVGVSDQLPNVQNIRPLYDAREIVFPTNTQLKSAVGNVGFFDMTNPNIYKALVPSGIATSLAIDQQRNGGNTSYAQNGQKMRFYQNGLDWKPKSMQDGGVQKTSEEIKKEQEEIKKARETAFRTIQPSSYDDLKNMGRWMFNIQRETYDDPRSEEFWRNYLKQPGELQYLKPSQYKPTISKNKDVNYYSVDNELEKAIFDSFKDKLEIKEIKKANESDISGKYNTDTLQNFVISNPGLGDRNPSGSIARALGNFTVSKGMDDRGEYISYYDTYDFPEWIQNKVKGEPYEIYGRIYYPNEENNKRNGGIVKDNDGYLNPNNFGKVVEIDSNNITMEGVYEPLLGISDTGDTKLMQPGKNYKFKGKKVTEFPIAQDGKFINQYTINRGDTLSAISKKTGYSVEQLAKINNIEDPDKIYAGEKLIIPYKFDKPLKIKDIPQEHHKNFVIDDYSKSFNYLVQGDKVYYTKKGNDNWVDISDNNKAKGNLYNHLKSKYQMKGYSDYEKSIGKSIADSVYNYDQSYDQRYNSKLKNYVELAPEKPKSLELKGVTSNSFNDSFRQSKSQPVINDPFGRLNRIKPGVTKKEEHKGWLDYVSGVYDDVVETVSDVSDKVSEYFDLGVNWAERQYNKNSDAREESSFIKEPIITNSEYNINRPIITGDTLKIDEDRYYLPEVMDLNEFTFNSRNRNELFPIETDAASITAFNPFQSYESVKELNFPKNANFIGVDDKGNFKSGTIDQFNPSDKLSRVFKNNVESFVTDDKGKMKFVRWSDNTIIDGKRVGNKDNPNSYVPLVNVINDSDKKTVGTLNILTKSPDDSGTFGQITGGRLVLKQGDKQVLVSGSINDIKNQFDKLVKNGPVEVFTLDNGSYSRGLRTYNQKITEDQLRDYDLQNVGGGHFLYSTGEKPRNKYQESRYQTPNIRTESDESYLKGHPLKNELQGVVLHQTAYKDKDLSGVHNQFMTPNKNSAHVLIGYDGERRVYADPEQVTFHGGKSSFKGRSNVNDFMLGVEFQGVAGEDRLTDAQIESAVEYLTPIIRNYNIPIEHITSHATVAPGRKHDISDADLDKIYKIIRDRLYTKKRNGGSVGINDLDAQPMKKLNQLTNFTNNPDKTNWLEKYN